MGWVLRLVETGTEDPALGTDVMEISRPPVTAQRNRCRRREPKAAWTKSPMHEWQSDAGCGGRLAQRIA